VGVLEGEEDVRTTTVPPVVSKVDAVLSQVKEKTAGRSSACPKCGGLNGLHQKGCK
jgi:hypothetical protein